MPAQVRKLALLVHVLVSVGSIGAVLAFVTLAVVGLAGDDAATLRAAYPSMDLIARLVIVPLILLSLLTGLLESFGTPWGLFRYYWVVVKLVVTGLATLILFAHLSPIHALADAAAAGSVSALRDVQLQMVAAAVAAVVALVLMTVLSIYKPKGLTAYGWRQQQRA